MQSLQKKNCKKIKNKKQILGQTAAQSRGAIIKKSLNVNDSSRVSTSPSGPLHTSPAGEPLMGACCPLPAACCLPRGTPHYCGERECNCLFICLLPQLKQVIIKKIYLKQSYVSITCNFIHKTYNFRRTD